MESPEVARRRARTLLLRPDTLAYACTKHLPEGRFMLAPHVRYLAGEVVRACITPGTHMTIEAPVRHGKSMLLSQWLPAWYLGMWPDRRVMLASYEADFAANWGGKARDILEEHGHLYGVQVNPASSAKDRWDILGTTGGMITAGVGGALTGRGAHLLLIDDPFKNADEALSPTIRQKRWEWLQSTAMTRLEPGGVVIITMARWHEDDFIGRLHSDEYVKPGRWKRIRLSALAQAGDPLGRAPGEALWPKRYSRATLEQIAVDRGSYWFGALYQQNPTPLGGGIFKRENFRTWLREGTAPDAPYVIRREGGVMERYDPRNLVRFQTWDLAATVKTTSDYTVCATWGLTPKRDLLLLDLLRVRVEGADHLSMLHDQYAKWLPAWIGIESVQYQVQLVQTAIRDGLPARKLQPDGDKVARALTAAARYEAHAIFHPSEAGAPWLPEFERELLTFPTGTHDDTVDVVSYAAGAIMSQQLSSAWRDALAEQAA